MRSSSAPPDPKASVVEAVELYFKRFGFLNRLIAESPHPELSLVVVIPSYDEPDLLTTLDSLRGCEVPDGAVEVLVIVNSSEDEVAAVLQRNAATVAQAQDWASAWSEPRRRFHILHLASLPPAHAGVGLARKIGMDEALRRLAEVGRIDAPIVCLDADCRCDPNYLRALEKHFRAHPKTPGCSVYFEHPILAEGQCCECREGLCVHQAIEHYEIHLRYYIQALRWCEFPSAFHTVGSSMAVRAQAYAKQGGMNRRKAGEDFYFLRKIIELGDFTEVLETRVIPSGRESHRVPFGTGRAVTECVRTGGWQTYSLQSFSDLRILFSQVGSEKEFVPSLAALSPVMREFLQSQGWEVAVEEIRSNTGSRDAFVKRFFRWFDAFRVLKFVHFARDQAYGPGDLVENAEALQRVLHFVPLDSGGNRVRRLLQAYRDLDRQVITPSLRASRANSDAQSAMG